MIIAESEKSLTKDELEQLRVLEASYYDIAIKMGETELQLNRLQHIKKQLIAEYQEYLCKEQALLSDMQSKYGDVQIDKETGKIISR